ncbi:sigma-70 family RNA polymerase sigma factor [Fictibacillus aquaticus]|uniref:RNA polymerase n=1 Tax=Fictibacillus aquaticus TaxID=2021314 RepID=A0A235F8V9_9BACL|nr:sigma-70 family RNA polymerase sigma factor [Fictibacillus aquaticus]OYD57692.1 RNA polymerase [Fictibacillus aquaticus]
MQQLIEKAKRGDDAAFLELFNEYQDLLYRMAFLHVKNKDDALDVVQETAYKSFKNLSTLKSPHYFKTWLIKITMSTAIDLLRKKKKITVLKPEYAESLPTSDHDIALSLSLKEMLNTLTEEEKSIVFLKYYDDCTIQEIADTVEIPLGTVKSVLYRALGKLRKQVRRADL